MELVNQCIKFEVSRFTRYKAMNGGAKCRKWGGLGRLGGTQGHATLHTGYYICSCYSCAWQQTYHMATDSGIQNVRPTYITWQDEC